MIKELIKAHHKIEEMGLVVQNFGNISCRVDNDFIIIKPSGIEASRLSNKNIVKVNLKNNKSIGKFKPSSDTATHSVIYKYFPEVNSIIHTHSLYATSWAQSKRSIPCLGTTHADFWKNEIPLIPLLKKNKILDNYELNTGISIIEFFKKNKLSYLDYPGVLLASHGPFVWGKNLKEALSLAEAIEFIAKLAFNTFKLGNNKKIPRHLSDKHFNRKHGSKKYYGQ